MTHECIPVQLPSMGEGVNEATIVKWLKQKGEKVQKDEPLIEVSTDKVDTEVASPSTGYLVAIYTEEGSVVEVEQVMAYLAASPDIEPPKLPTQVQPPNQKKAGAPAAKHVSQHHTPSIPGNSAFTNLPISPGSYAGVIRSSPLVKKMAKEHSLNLNYVQGTGLYGRITKKDVLSFIAAGGNRHVHPGTIPTSSDEKVSLKTSFRDGQEYLEGVRVERKKMSKMRKLTAEHMLQSVKTSPHVTTTFEVDLERISHIKKEITDSFREEYGQKITYTSFFIEAAIYALKLHPQMNSSVDNDEILYKDSVNIGCAVAIDSGLIVPVIKQANELTLGQIAQALGDLVSRARNKKLKPEDIAGGTFSITNPGMYGSIHSQPIINQPQVGIMSIGAIVQRPVAIEGKVVIHPLCQIGITFDHRLIDGEGGAKFLADIKRYLETYELR
ncbi:MAG: dihydrolipoamide acetyltransferase family protein [Oligoflexales bacterium]